MRARAWRAAELQTLCWLSVHTLPQLDQRRLIDANEAAVRPVKIENHKGDHHDQEVDSQREAEVSFAGLAQRMADHRAADPDAQRRAALGPSPRSTNRRCCAIDELTLGSRA